MSHSRTLYFSFVGHWSMEGIKSSKFNDRQLLIHQNSQLPDEPQHQKSHRKRESDRNHAHFRASLVAQR